jgi:hypothetical protein
MTTAEVLGHLKNVRVRGAHTIAQCPAHPDRHPSLSISDGEKGVLVKCWAGCSLHDICSALGLTPKDLFYDALDTDPQQRKAAVMQREAQRREREREGRQLGRLLDACREAEHFLQLRQPVDISTWSDDRLNHELCLIADAYRILEADPYAAH